MNLKITIWFFYSGCVKSQEEENNCNENAEKTDDSSFKRQSINFSV